MQGMNEKSSQESRDYEKETNLNLRNEDFDNSN
jgi:hypothetical protein